MKYVLPILAVALATLSCSKKDSPGPLPTSTTPASGTGSYKLDGRTINCTARATLCSPAGSNATYLTVFLNTTPQPASGPDYIQVDYTRITGQPTATYQPNLIAHFINGQPQGLFLDKWTATVLDTSGGGFTSTFSSTSTSSNSPQTITDGVYTDARP